eukprot:TRINITY_DN102397_c0_g1_i1.p1 TRINITY_DN102397_c0_g1~~TRINITY_DN102397_c0_g1_i1.p1  ORF type:complete len:814 (+),score=155.03 TRINITY_DN102397_c0_g1_i1:130-2571(+)
MPEAKSLYLSKENSQTRRSAESEKNGHARKREPISKTNQFQLSDSADECDINPRSLGSYISSNSGGPLESSSRGRVKSAQAAVGKRRQSVASSGGKDVQMKLMGTQIQQAIISEMKRFGSHLKEELVSEVRAAIAEAGGRSHYSALTAFDSDRPHGFGTSASATEPFSANRCDASEEVTWMGKWSKMPASVASQRLRHTARVADSSDSDDGEDEAPAPQNNRKAEQTMVRKKLVQFTEDGEVSTVVPMSSLPNQVPSERISPPSEPPDVLPAVDARDRASSSELDGMTSNDENGDGSDDESETVGDWDCMLEPKKNNRARLDINREMARAKQQDKDTKPIWRMSVEELLQSTKFDNLIGSIIICNAITIGAQTDFGAKNLTDDVPSAFKTLDTLFCIVFTTELSLRFYVHKLEFLRLCGDGWMWNYFDTFVVFAQLLEYGLEFVAASSQLDAGQIKQMRVLRVLRLLRILRVVRILHLISELRTIVSSIVGSFKSLGWTVILLLLMIYIVAIFFTQSITERFVMHGEPDVSQFNADENALRNYFGSLGRAVLTLWQAMSGGLDWDGLAGPLLNELGIFTSLMFASYIAFAILALMNVVTGVFVQTALNSAKEEEESFMTDQIVSLFHITDNGENPETSEITLAAIIGSLEDPVQAKEWNSVGVAAEEARYVFQLLDIDDSGSIPFQEFLGGCLRINGHAKSLDVLTVMQEARKNHENMLNEFTEMKKAVDALSYSVYDIGLSGESPGSEGKGISDKSQRSIETVRKSVRSLERQHAVLHNAVDDIRSSLSSLRALQDLVSNDPYSLVKDTTLV